MKIDLRTLERRSPWLFAALSLVPLIWCWPSFRDLFWFGDDWDMLDQIWRAGFWQWTVVPFGENFAPLFKAIWGGAALAGDGSYALMILLSWLLHAFNVALFGLWLRRNDFGPVALGTTLVGFGLAVTNVETLGWSVQLGMVLTQTFFFGAALWLDHRRNVTGSWSWPALLVLFILVAGSALSFARGVLTGATLAAMVLLGPLLARSHRNTGWAWRTLLFATCAIPSIAVAVVISRYAGGNQHQLFGGEGVLGPAAGFGASYFLASPFFGLLEIDGWGWRTIAVLGLVKLAFLAEGFRRATPSQRRTLATLLLLDLGTATLLGIGRYHTGFYAATSSRYQYVSLCCFAPFFALALEHGLARARLPERLRPLAGLVAVSGVFWIVAHSWPHAMSHWAESRGRQTREILFVDPNPPAEGAIPGIPFLSTQRAKELVAHYHLH